CRTLKIATTYYCAASPELYVDKAHTPVAGDMEVYKQTGHLGVAWGNPIVSAGTGQTTGWQLDYSNSAQSTVPAFRFAPESGATDLITTETSDGEYLNMYLSFTGPIQNHRSYDQGLYVRADNALEAEKWLVATGNDHTIALLRRPGSTVGRTIYAWGDN